MIPDGLGSISLSFIAALYWNASYLLVTRIIR